MRFSRRLVRAFLSTGLAILFAFLAVMRIPQAAFGFVSSSIIRGSSHESQLLSANTPQEAIAQFQERLICLKTEQIPINNFNSEPAKIKEVVRRLAKTKDFRECINRNGITGVNPDTLVGVIFTSAVADKFGVVVVGAGLKQSTDVTNNIPTLNPPPGTVVVVKPRSGVFVKPGIVVIVPKKPSILTPPGTTIAPPGISIIKPGTIVIAPPGTIVMPPGTTIQSPQTIVVPPGTFIPSGTIPPTIAVIVSSPTQQVKLSPDPPINTWISILPSQLPSQINSKYPNDQYPPLPKEIYYLNHRDYPADELIKQLQNCADLAVPDKIDLKSPPSNLMECYPQLSFMVIRANNLINSVTKGVIDNVLPNSNNKHNDVLSLTFDTQHQAIDIVGSAFSGQYDSQLPTGVEIPKVEKCFLGFCSDTLDFANAKVTHGGFLWGVDVGYHFAWSLGDIAPYIAEVNFPNHIFGGVTINASALMSILNGKIPSLGQILQTVDFNVDKIITTQRTDVGQKRKDEIRQMYPNTFLYFASENFENANSLWQIIGEIIADGVTFGALSSKIVDSHIQDFVDEFTHVTKWLQFVLTTKTITLAINEIKQLLETGKLSKPNFPSLSMKAFSATITTEKCWKNQCVSLPNQPRFGFAVIVEK